MDLEVPEFKKSADRVTAWIASYLDNPERFPVLANVRPGDIASRLPTTPPTHGEPIAAILDDFERVILPGVTHWNHPGFMAYFAISASAPGILAEMLMAALDTNAMLWRTSPSATELELRVLDWLRQMIGLSPEWFGIINDTASISTMLALAAAREAHGELEIRAKGMAGRADLPRLRIYASEHAHSSVDKGAITVGLGHENVVKIGADESFRMRADLLQRAMADDRAAGMLPLAVVATVGTTSTTSVDPVREIAAICRRERAWLHVDASYAGVAAIVPELRHTLDGVDAADSLVLNPHKWLFTPVDISAMYTRHQGVLRRTFSLVPEYLVTAEQDDVVNLMDYGVQLGRRFRALKLWMVIRAFGVDGLAERLRQHVALAQELASWIAGEPSWELLAPVPFSVVCFRFAPDDASESDRNRMNQEIIERVNSSGRVFLSHTKLGDVYTIRVAIGNIRTMRTHVEEAWTLLRAAAAEVLQARAAGARA